MWRHPLYNNFKNHSGFSLVFNLQIVLQIQIDQLQQGWLSLWGVAGTRITCYGYKISQPEIFQEDRRPEIFKFKFILYLLSITSDQSFLHNLFDIINVIKNGGCCFKEIANICFCDETLIKQSSTAEMFGYIYPL